MIQNPCVPGCPKRTGECHATCKKYAIYAAQQEKLARERQQKNDEAWNAEAGLRRVIHLNDRAKKRGRA